MMNVYQLSILLMAALSTASPLPESSARSSCTTYTVLFARGTTETGTLGTIVGPGLEQAVDSALGSGQVTFTGITYPADIAGIESEISGSGPGSVAMAQDAATALASCPSTKLILTGYSQGAMVVHNAATKLQSSSQISSVVAAVTFGDPYKTTLPAGIVAADFHTFCASGDEVCGYGSGTCAGTGGCTSASTSGHLGYGADVDTAASFIKSVVGTGTTGSTATVASGSSPAVTSGSTVASNALGSLPTGLAGGDAGFSFPTTLPTGFSGFGFR